MRRGDVVVVDLDPIVGSEASKRRPCIVVSNDGRNAVSRRNGRGVITVVPVTSNITRIYDFQTFLPAERTGLRSDSKAQAEQIRSVDVARVGAAIASLPSDLMVAVDDAIRIHLSL